MKKKILRITTVPISLKILLKEQLKYMNKYFEVVGVSSEGDELRDVESDEGIRVVELDMSRKITPFKDFISLFKMIVLILKEKPDIIHTHTPKAGIIGMLASWICRVPVRLHTVAGLPVMEASGKKKDLLLFVEKLTYFCSTKVYPNSYGLQKYILDNKLAKSEKLKVIGHGSSNGIDTDYFNPSLFSMDKNSDEFVFIFIGRVVKDKGVNELLFAFDELSKEYKNIKLKIVGKFENDLDPISNDSIKILNSNKNIINVGFQTDIRPYLASSDCFVLPTYREGFPNVVLQACSMKLPCVVTNINGCNEIIQDGYNGLIVESKNKNDLFNAMKRFIDDKTLGKKLALNSRKNIVEKYDRKKFHQMLLDEYNEVIDA